MAAYSLSAKLSKLQSKCKIDERKKDDSTSKFNLRHKSMV